MIYFITDGENVKIGYTKNNPEERLSAMQVGNPKELKLACVVDGDYEEEKIYHKLFKQDYLRGEWFELSDNIKKFIKRKNPEFFESPKPLKPVPAEPKGIKPLGLKPYVPIVPLAPRRKNEYGVDYDPDKDIDGNYKSPEYFHKLYGKYCPESIIGDYKIVKFSKVPKYLGFIKTPRGIRCYIASKNWADCAKICKSYVTELKIIEKHDAFKLLETYLGDRDCSSKDDDN